MSPSTDYSAGLDAATTRTALLQVIDRYRLVADDAYREVSSWDERTFDDFRLGLSAERRFARSEPRHDWPDRERWEQRYATVLMPEIMFRCDMVASKYGTPWGTAFIRLREVGRIGVRRRHDHVAAVWNEQ